MPRVLSEEEFAAAFPGEGEFVEFKQGVSPQRVQETAVSFSNADGGVLIAGVAPDGLLVVSVDRRREGFSQTSSGAVLVRRGASNVALLGAELPRFLSRRSFETFELTPTSATVNDAPAAIGGRPYIDVDPRPVHHTIEIDDTAGWLLTCPYLRRPFGGAHREDA